MKTWGMIWVVIQASTAPWLPKASRLTAGVVRSEAGIQLLLGRGFVGVQRLTVDKSSFEDVYTGTVKVLQGFGLRGQSRVYYLVATRSFNNETWSSICRKKAQLRDSETLPPTPSGVDPNP